MARIKNVLPRSCHDLSPLQKREYYAMLEKGLEHVKQFAEERAKAEEIAKKEDNNEAEQEGKQLKRKRGRPKKSEKSIGRKRIAKPTSAPASSPVRFLPSALAPTTDLKPSQDLVRCNSLEPSGETREPTVPTITSN